VLAEKLGGTSRTKLKITGHPGVRQLLSVVVREPKAANGNERKADKAKEADFS
jgi:hypothetical protein